MIRTRAAGAGDIESINQVFYNFWRSAYRGIIADHYLDRLPADHWCEFLEQGLKDHRMFILVLEREVQIIGAAVLSPAERDGVVHLISFYIRPEEIGTGLGHIFYQDIEAEARKRGYTGCVLDVLKSNQRAARFYHLHGFHLTGKTTEAALGERIYTCDIWEKDLPGNST